MGYGSDILILRYQASQLYPNTDDPLLATVSDKSMIDCAGNNVATVPDPRNPGTAADSRIVSIFHVALNNGEPALMLSIVMQDAWNGLDLGRALADRHRVLDL